MTAIESQHEVHTRDDEPEGSPGSARSERRPGSMSSERWPYRLPLVVLLVGVLVSLGLALISSALYRANEKRLLDLRAREASSVLTASVPNIQTPLASAAELAEVTNGNAARFKAFADQLAGPGPTHQFASLSLWRVRPAQRGPLAVVGASPVLESTPGAQSFLARAARMSRLSVIALLEPPSLRLGYAFGVPARPTEYVAYGETPLPRNRRQGIQRNSAFSDIDYAIYLGRAEQPSRLLVTSVRHLPFRGRTAVSRVAFGDTALTLVVSARRPLAGSLPQRLPWIIAIVGFVLAFAAGTLTLRLMQRRREAEQLAATLERIAGENRQLYAEQRDIAQTLQHALLPDVLPKIRGAEAEARYETGERGVEIGGDWYDVIALDDRRLLVVVGDVSGHGLRAAATMASLRYAIHAYAVLGDSPSEILTKLSRLLSVASSGQLATVLFMLVDVDARKVTVTSAGHLPPLLISDGSGEYIRGEVGLPVGVDRAARYESVTASVPPGSTLLAFTDGLVERRGEHLDQGLQRLCDAARSNHVALPDLLQRLVREVRNDPAEDDTAIVGLRWLD